jgi:hypothetical protein
MAVEWELELGKLLRVVEQFLRVVVGWTSLVISLVLTAREGTADLLLHLLNLLGHFGLT